MNNFDFKIIAKSRKSKARAGVISTPHGKINTPAFVPCATKGSLKSLSPEDINNIGCQLLFVNTYHMVLSPGVDVIEAAGGIHAFSKISKPIITDSGGFQVFSLAKNRQLQLVSNVIPAKAGIHSNGSPIKSGMTKFEENPHLVRITDDGVEFRSHIDGRKYFFSPEFSIEAQRKIGADFVVAFDECLPVGATERQTERSVRRTHEWAERSLKSFVQMSEGKGFSGRYGQRLVVNSFFKSNTKTNTSSQTYKPLTVPQKLYGVIQGGMFQHWREKSAEFIAGLPFWGLAIGGVSVGESKTQMREQVKWVTAVLGDDPRPRHLLGIGEIDDILDLVKMGVDTFDCVLPTRMARNGKLFIKISNKIQETSYLPRGKAGKQINILKPIFKQDLSPIDENCQCYTCQNFSRAYLHHLFKQRELLGLSLATIHNLYFMETLFKNIRIAIKEDKL